MGALNCYCSNREKIEKSPEAPDPVQNEFDQKFDFSLKNAKLGACMTRIALDFEV